MTRAVRLCVAAVALAAPSVASAQALVCAAPAVVPVPNADLPTPDQPQRVLPIGGYTLAITWAPQYCRNGGFTPAARFECGSGNRFAFTLHGLWPDGVGKDWPQYCAATPILPPATVKNMLCKTPSAQLVQHEWAKHGTCTGLTPVAYFGKSSRLYARLRYPDMNALSRGPLTVGQFVAAFAAANPRIPANAVRVTASRGWLDELWLCLDTRLAYTRCRAGTGGLAANASLKIWRGGRRPR
ncbi:ribonuclease T2 family protein [Sphingomonas sp.]|jgi:ribonuclease T2|uniref:ribonuclease T2 family protein n=1 Tax=Sphingomonas sp. TaxID=28214 RepID=UPI002E34A240|nr:ribonuclease T [Sphingomonas sp.]HEX4694821.1 ribonuclease T [Sphingomonas sp.]